MNAGGGGRKGGAIMRARTIHDRVDAAGLHVRWRSVVRGIAWIRLAARVCRARADRRDQAARRTLAQTEPATTSGAEIGDPGRLRIRGVLGDAR